MISLSGVMPAASSSARTIVQFLEFMSIVLLHQACPMEIDGARNVALSKPNFVFAPEFIRGAGVDGNESRTLRPRPSSPNAFPRAWTVFQLIWVDG
jgi:hypothetical protein